VTIILFDCILCLDSLLLFILCSTPPPVDFFVVCHPKFFLTFSRQFPFNITVFQLLAHVLCIYVDPDIYPTKRTGRDYIHKLICSISVTQSFIRRSL